MDCHILGLVSDSALQKRKKILHQGITALRGWLRGSHAQEVITQNPLVKYLAEQLQIGEKNHFQPQDENLLPPS